MRFRNCLTDLLLVCFCAPNLFDCLCFLPHSGDVRMDYCCWWMLSVRGMCISTAWNKIDGCTTADVPNFPAYRCNVRCFRDSCTLFLLSGKSPSCHSPELGWDNKPSICYSSQEYCIRDCSPACIVQPCSECFESSRAICFTKGSNTPVEMHNQNAFLRLPRLS